MILFLIAIHGFAPGNNKPRLSRGFKVKVTSLPKKWDGLNGITAHSSASHSCAISSKSALRQESVASAPRRRASYARM
jgi:hypothetical protein